MAALVIAPKNLRLCTVARTVLSNRLAGTTNFPIFFIFGTRRFPRDAKAVLFDVSFYILRILINDGVARPPIDFKFLTIIHILSAFIIRTSRLNNNN